MRGAGDDHGVIDVEQVRPGDGNAANLSGDVATTTSGLTQAQLDALSATYNVTAIVQGITSGGQTAADIAIAFNATATGSTANVTVNT